MYARHVNSAIGRGRPDLVRVSDGIAASLRQFSISARRSADEDVKVPSRTQRSANATREVSDLAPPPTPSRGIDARSLAAKPPPSSQPRFTITRFDPTPGKDSVQRRVRPEGGFSRPPSSTFVPRTPGFGGMRGGSGFRGRGGARGGARGGRGGRGGGLRGSNARFSKGKPKFAEEVDYEILPYTEEELPDYDMIMGGLPEVYNPVTSHASLAGWGPSVITSQQGYKDTIDQKLGVAVDKKYPGWNEMSWHKKNIAKGGMTVFKDAAEREAARAYQKGKGWAGAQYTELSAEQKEKLSQQWVGGHYDGPVAVDRKDVLGQVARYARSNSTFLAEETKQFEEDVAKLLPASHQKPVAKTP